MINTANRTPDSKIGLQLLLVLDGFIRLFIWSAALALTVGTLTWFAAWPEHDFVGAGWAEAWIWGRSLTHLILLFNLYYVALLVALRLVVPTPREGEYRMTGAWPDRQLLWSALLSVLSKARYHPPFPGFLVFHIANLPPMRWLMNPIFGPRSRSCYVLDPILGDPSLTEIGRNVVFGFGSSVTCHTQQRDAIAVKRVVIGDDVLIGAQATIFSGCRIGRGAVILAGAVVPPDTIVGDYEVWGGLPAKKIKVFPRPGTP